MFMIRVGDWMENYALVSFILLVSLTHFFLPVILHTEYTNWDLKKDYYAAKAYSMGYNPYSNLDLSKVAESKITLPYVYPPWTLAFFKLFTLFPYAIVPFIYLVSKVFILVYLIHLWGNYFHRRVFTLDFIPFLLLAYNASVLIDLQAGNVSLYEQALIWTAFLFLLRDKLGPFCVFILAASAFKLYPIAFIFLVLASKKQTRHIYLGLSLLAFLAYLITPYFLSPNLFTGYVRNVYISLFELDYERGVVNPSSISFIRDVYARLGFFTGFETSHLVYPTYLLFACSILFFSFQAFRSLSAGGDKKKIMVFLFCIVYALLAPRFKDYSHILLVLPAYFMIDRFSKNRTSAYIAYVFPVFVFTAVSGFLYGLWGYYSLALVFFMWLFYVREYS